MISCFIISLIGGSAFKKIFYFKGFAIAQLVALAIRGIKNIARTEEAVNVITQFINGVTWIIDVVTDIVVKAVKNTIGSICKGLTTNLRSIFKLFGF